LRGICPSVCIVFSVWFSTLGWVGNLRRVGARLREFGVLPLLCSRWSLGLWSAGIPEALLTLCMVLSSPGLSDMTADIGIIWVWFSVAGITRLGAQPSAGLGYVILQPEVDYAERLLES